MRRKNVILSHEKIDEINVELLGLYFFGVFIERDDKTIPSILLFHLWENYAG